MRKPMDTGGKHDFYAQMERANNDTAAAAKLTACLRYAVSYGMRKRESYLTTKDREKLETTAEASDNAAFGIIQQMQREDMEDLQNNVYLYMVERMDNEAFRSIPAEWQLMRAGDDIVKKEYDKRVRRARAGIVSLDEMQETGQDVVAFDDLTTAEAESMIKSIVARVPKKHRERAESIIKQRYSLYEVSTVQAVAKAERCSQRTVKSIIAEIKAVGKPLLTAV